MLRLPLQPETLRQLIEEALLRRQMSDDFVRVSEEVEIASRELVRVEEERRRLEAENRSLQERDRNGYAILQEVMHQLPWPVFGIDSDGMLALVNDAALAEFGERLPVIGTPFDEILPDAPPPGKSGIAALGGTNYRVWWREVRVGSELFGHMLFLQREGT